MKSRKEVVKWAAMHLVGPIVVVAAALMFIFLADRLQEVNRQNQSYSRFVTCVLSVPALDRNQEKIDRCYKLVEEETDVKIQKY